MEEIDIKELLGLFWSKKLEIIIIAAIVAVLGVIYSFTMVTPRYQASTTLVLASLKEKEEGQTITQTDITINSKLVATYSELVKSKAVLREALTNLELTDKISEDSLRKSIKVKSLEDTEIIQITVENEDSEIAAKLANEIARIFSVKVAEIYNVNNVHVVDQAETTTKPSNVNHLRDIAIFMAVGLVLGFAEVLIIKLLDNKIRTEQDIETSTELLVLGMLPKNNYLEEDKRREA